MGFPKTARRHGCAWARPALEAFRADERVDEIDGQAGGDRRAEYIVDQHFSPSHAFAGAEIGEADAEKSHNEDQPDKIEHLRTLR